MPQSADPPARNAKDCNAALRLAMHAGAHQESTRSSPVRPSPRRSPPPDGSHEGTCPFRTWRGSALEQCRTIGLRSAGALEMIPRTRRGSCDRPGRVGFPSDSASEGGELLRHPNALRTLGLGVRRIQENVHASIIELKMTADGQGSEAAPPYRPNGDQAKSSPSRYWISRCL